ncbi:MAG: amidohydrolase family protein, partial [Mycobacterium sp.]
MPEELTLIRGGTVITLEPGVPDQVADILIDGDQIAAVGPDLNVADGSARIVDAADHIVVPGFIDTHRHVYQILLRGLGSNWSLMQYAAAIIQTGQHFTPEDLYLANRLGALDAIDSGVTALFDWSQNQSTPEHTDALIAGLESTSIRAMFGSGINLLDLVENMAPPFLSTKPTNAAEVRRLRARYPSDTGLLTIGIAARGPELSTMDVVAQDWALARELGIRLNMHLGNGIVPGRPSVVALNNAGLLGDDLTFGHCNFLTDEEITLMADHGVTASVTPEDESNMGHGWPPIGRLI